ncbi:hypothetical protein LCGC14_0604950 [marine sediment metagenome]|uniref:SPOR domain-containing protein n=1 Tax=marine sediment metagenome TaxID=412755 RepID=A0A0F9R9I7_9ZZZZ|nr:hypothetical protein [Methylophaga sp.]HEC58956.1 hypothetical protein [Methylophaga sp.]
MTTVQLQRIIGVALLFSVVIAIAMLLIRSADESTDEQTSKLAFKSERTETKLPYVSEAIINLEAAAKDSEELALEQKVEEDNSAPAFESAKVAPLEPVKTPLSGKASAPEKVTPPTKNPVPAQKMSEPVKSIAIPKKTSEPVKATAPTKASVPAKSSVPAKVTQTQPAEKWVIQLASFSVKANADALNVQAKQMGYKSVIEDTDTANGKIYRVRIEPMTDKQQAQAVASEIDSKMKLNTQVLQE